MVSTANSKYWLQVVDGNFGHLKKVPLNLNAEDRELSYAAA